MNTDDRELLELAAKAAGVNARRLPHAWPGRFDDEQWNPLADDGDALRLAVKLNMMEEGRKPFFELMWRLSTEKGTDDYDTTRRAIVRAAASIGRG